MIKDPSFGPIITVGLGGIFVEIFNDVATLCRLLIIRRRFASAQAAIISVWSEHVDNLPPI